MIRKAMRQAGLDGLDDIRLATREEDGAFPVLLRVDGHETLHNNPIDGRLGRLTWPLLLITSNASRSVPSGP